MNWRLVPYAVADGPTNMATDEALLMAALTGVATLLLAERVRQGLPGRLGVMYERGSGVRRQSEQSRR